MSTQFLHEKKVKTKKEYKCFACSDVFKSGSKMSAQTSTCDGEIYTLYFCETCATLLKEFDDVFFDDGITYENSVLDTMYGMKCETTEELLELLRSKKDTTDAK